MAWCLVKHRTTLSVHYNIYFTWSKYKCSDSLRNGYSCNVLVGLHEIKHDLNVTYNFYLKRFSTWCFH